MPTWGGILKELKATPQGQLNCDDVRRKYLAALYQHTGRNTVLYATKFTQSVDNSSAAVEATIRDEDLQGLMETLHGLKGPNLDLILHSPGGSGEAAAGFVAYLRSKFKHIRVVVPSLAMSAATMIACAADEIMMGKHSFLGPIDPQILVNTQIGQRMAPAQAILRQFRMAQEECADPKKMAAWIPILGQYGPDLLVQCQNASDRSESMVSDWLRRYMFKRDKKAGKDKAAKIAKWLAFHEEHLSHSRHLSRTELRRHGLNVKSLEGDQQAQDLFLSVFHATTHTFTMTPAMKIIENHAGRAFVKMVQTMQVMPKAKRVTPAVVPAGGGQPSAPNGTSKAKGSGKRSPSS